MMNVLSKRCVHENCMKMPNFNYSTETKTLFCFEHKMHKLWQKKYSKNDCLYLCKLKQTKLNRESKKEESKKQIDTSQIIKST